MGKKWKLKKFTQTDRPVFIVRNEKRFFVLVDIDGLVIPFYTSSGEAEKLGPDDELFGVGDFFPFIGRTKSWINKTNFTWKGEPSETAIDTYYGIPELGKIASILNKTVDYEKLIAAKRSRDHMLNKDLLMVDVNQGLYKYNLKPTDRDASDALSIVRSNINKIKEILAS